MKMKERDPELSFLSIVENSTYTENLYRVFHNVLRDYKHL